MVGAGEGFADGREVGFLVGAAEGLPNGSYVSMNVGSKVGNVLGAVVGSAIVCSSIRLYSRCYCPVVSLRGFVEILGARDNNKI